MGSTPRTTTTTKQVQHSLQQAIVMFFHLGENAEPSSQATSQATKQGSFVQIIQVFLVLKSSCFSWRLSVVCISLFLFSIVVTGYQRLGILPSKEVCLCGSQFWCIYPSQLGWAMCRRGQCPALKRINAPTRPALIPGRVVWSSSPTSPSRRGPALDTVLWGPTL